MFRVARRAPPAITTYRPVTVWSSTRSVVRSTKRARPCSMPMPALAKLRSFCSGTGSVKVRLKRMRSGQSIVSPGAGTPLLCIRRSQSTSSETPTSTFLGSQPRSWQVPPNGRESITATLWPASRTLYATDWAAEPVPITITSTVVAMVLPGFDTTTGRQEGAPVRQAPAPCLVELDDLSLHLALSRPGEGGFPGLEEVRVGAPVIDGPGGLSVIGKENDDLRCRWLARRKLQADRRPCCGAAGEAPGIGPQCPDNPDDVVRAPGPEPARAEPEFMCGRRRTQAGGSEDVPLRAQADPPGCVQPAKVCLDG